MIFSGFAGYRHKYFRLGAEYNHQLNYQANEGYSRYGYSIYSTIVLHPKWELFARYDQLYSNVLPEEVIPWNLGNDGSALLAGIQYAPISRVRFALNYQDWVEYARNGSTAPFLYLNIEVVF
jgi:hypothetical protein